MVSGATDGESNRGRTHKSAPMVALYWLLNRLLTYWFMREVLPTLQRQPLRHGPGGEPVHTTYPLSPRMIT